MPCRPVTKPAGVRRYVLPGSNPGLLVRGNIDLFSRPLVKVRGGYSTVRSTSFTFDNVVVLIPQVVKNKVVPPLGALRHYRQTGRHLGIFDTVGHANAYANRLHRQQAKIYCL